MHHLKYVRTNGKYETNRNSMIPKSAHHDKQRTYIYRNMYCITSVWVRNLMFAFETETKKLDFSAVDPPADSRVTHTHTGKPHQRSVSVLRKEHTLNASCACKIHCCPPRLRTNTYDRPSGAGRKAASMTAAKRRSGRSRKHKHNPWDHGAGK